MLRQHFRYPLLAAPGANKVPFAGLRRAVESYKVHLYHLWHLKRPSTMPTLSALQFAQQGPFSQVRAFAGDVLFKEGMPAAHLYVIKEGEVDLYHVRDEKRTVIETLRKGQCFGVDTRRPGQPRAHHAAARTYCELYLIDNPAAIQAIQASHDLVQDLLDGLSERLAVAHELIATRVNYQPDLLVYAQLLQLMGQAEIGQPPAGRRTHGAHGRGEAPLARPLLQDVFKHAHVLFGHSDRHVRGCIGKLVGLHLVRIEDGPSGSKQLVFAPRDLVAQVRKVVADAADGDDDKLTYEYVSLDEFAAIVDVDRSVLLRKLSAGEFADDVFTFRRTEIMRLLDTKGRRYFAERKLKPPSEFSEAADVAFADPRALVTAVSRVDSYDLAKLLASLDDEDTKARILGALPARRREDVEQDLKDLRQVDPMESQLLGQTLIQHVKAAMLQRAAA